MSSSSAAAAERAENIAMIRASAGAIVPDSDLQRIRALRFQEPGFDRTVWREICTLGWPGLRVPEAAGGSGLGMQEYCALLEELGAGLVPEPIIASALAARVLSGDLLAQLLAGDKIVLPAWQERANSLEFAGEARISNGRVSGRKQFVATAAGADAFLVTTRDGIAVVDAKAPGMTLTVEPTHDGGSFGTLLLSDAPAQIVSGDMEAALDEAALATSAYLLGVAERAFAITLDYLKTRKQFGREIGSFQSLQHRAVDLKIQLALTRASVESAATTLDAEPSAPLRQAAVSRAKARASETALLVTRQSIQMHGAIGYTDEYDVGLFLRKAMVLANLYGSAALHRARYAALNVEDLTDD
jgi:alkylation response protein AidB-like acyl-CoA dehydrogenase